MAVGVKERRSESFWAPFTSFLRFRALFTPLSSSISDQVIFGQKKEGDIVAMFLPPQVFPRAILQ